MNTCKVTGKGEMTLSLVEIAVEAWRFRKVFERTVSLLDAGEARRPISQYRWFLKKIEDNLKIFDLNVVDVEGLPYDPGMAVSALNLDEFEPDVTLVVDQMIEPIITNSEGLVRNGVVILREGLI